ncbi:hypothetical protein [Vibrio viridaestus]|uniref:hypothetical protein n=1 Tax=Vibrio viridaestus TaxID=2487322 RepID=UPI001FB68158|nr:hypothetical protein [Vibrio viridaestus]
MNAHINDDQHLEKPYLSNNNDRMLYGYTVLFPSKVGKGLDMYDEKKMFKTMLDVVIDGVSLSTVGNERGTAGKEILDCLMLKYPHLIDKDTIKQIQSIIEAADEVDNSAFRL